jgi:hypothetical protein
VVVEPSSALEQSEPKGFVYLDTNIVSYLARGDLPNFVPNILDAGAVPIVSDVVLQEVQNGSSSGEVEFIQRNGFWFASAHEAMFLDARRTFYARPIDIDADDSEFIEAFLRKFVRSISGSSSVDSLTTLLSNAAQSVLDEVAKELPPDADPRLLAAWDQSRKLLSQKFIELECLPTPSPLDSELKEVQRLAAALGNLRPPKILDQMITLIGADNSSFLVDMKRQFSSDENMKERIQLVCLTLVSMGFCRGKGLANDNEFKSDASARSQFADAYHIAAAASCSVFVTADSRCAKLAYAVYEALNFKTEVCLVRPKAKDEMFKIVGEAFWP